MKITRGGFFKQLFGGVAALVSMAKAGTAPRPPRTVTLPVEEPFTLAWSGHLGGDEIRTGLSLSVNQEFALRSIGVMHASGRFAFRVWGPHGPMWLKMTPSEDFLLSGLNLPIYPDLVIPKGGKIGLDVQDLTGSRNDVCVSFHGVKRYRIA